MRCVIWAALCALFPAALEAQALSVGDRARIVVRDMYAQDEAMAMRRLILRGDVTRFSADTVFLRPMGLTGEVGVPRAAALSIYRSRGLRPRAVSAVRSGVIWGLLGAALLALTVHESDPPFNMSNRGAAIALGAGIMAATGAVLGAVFPTERWQRVRQ